MRVLVPVMCALFFLTACSMLPIVSPSGATPGGDATGFCRQDWVDSVVSPALAPMRALGAETSSGVGTRADIEPTGLSRFVRDCVVVLAAKFNNQGEPSLWNQTWSVLKTDIDPDKVGQYLSAQGFQEQAPGAGVWLRGTSDDADKTTTMISVSVTAASLPPDTFPGAQFLMTVTKSIQTHA